MSRKWLWRLTVLLALTLPARAQPSAQPTVVQDQDQLLAALKDPNSISIWLASDIVLTADKYPPSGLQLARAVTIDLRGFTLDTQQAFRSMLCGVDACHVTIQTGTIINAIPKVPPTADFSTPIPNMLGVYANGSLTTQHVDVVSPAPTGLWLPSSLVYAPTASAWTGQISLVCQSPVEVVFSSWVSMHEARKIFLARPGPYESGFEVLTDVRMVLAQSFVCGANYTQAMCEGVLQICAEYNSPLPADSCTPTNLPRLCRPVPPMASHLPSSGSSTASAEGSSSSHTALIVGLAVGLGGGLLLLLAGLLAWFKLRRRPPPPANVHLKAVKVQHGTDAVADGSTHAAQPLTVSVDASLELVRSFPDQMLGGGVPAGATAPYPAGCVADPTQTPHALAHSTFSHVSPPATASEGSKPSSPTSAAAALAALQAPMLPGPPLAYVPQPVVVAHPAAQGMHDLHDATGLTYKSETGKGNYMLPEGEQQLPAQLQVAGAPRPAHQPLQPPHSVGSGVPAAVIDMAPVAPDSQLQLARNPLGVALHSVLGSGAYGTVYAGTWQGQPAAIKVITQQVSEPDDLRAILQFREATLGAELQHPRIVRTLAHALVVPEGLVDATGTLARPGTVEAHIVSSLCDRGTLKAWLQLAGRGQAPSSMATTLLAASQHPSPDGTAAAPAPSAPTPQGAAPGSSASLAVPGSAGDDAAPGHAAVAAADLTLQLQPAAGPNAAASPAGGIMVLARAASARITPQQGLAPGSSLAVLRSSSLQRGSNGSAFGGSGNFRDAVAASLFPPLACMPAWGASGLPLHAHLQCHLLAVVDCLLEVADGLSYLLSRGVVHGDLKPQNCLLCSDPADTLRGFTVKIGDFGISRVLHDTKSHTTVSQPPGTLAYFAPELLSTCRLSPACDLYSFGIIMYELLTCKQPLGGLSMAQVLYKKATGKVDEHLLYPPEVPPQYVQLARACYSLDASQRPRLPEIHARLSTLRHHITTEWTGPVPPPAPPTLSSSSPSTSSCQ